MTQTRKRWWCLWMLVVYVVVLGLSMRLQPGDDVDTSMVSNPPDRVVLFFDEVESGIWISDGAMLWVKDAAGERTLRRSLAHMRQTLTVPELDPLLQTTKAPYTIVAESYGAMNALALAMQYPSACDHLILFDARGLPAFERLGHPLLDRSLRSLQGGFAWMLRHGVPFAWKGAPALLETKLAAAIVAGGEVPLLLDSLSVPAAVTVVASSEAALAESLVLQQLLPHSRWVQADEIEAKDCWVRAALEGSGAAGGDMSLSPETRSVLRKQWAARNRVFEGSALWVAVALVALSTLMSEDLACVGAGLLVSHGALSFVAATCGCLAGIFLGDIALYGFGRLLGERVLVHRPFRWMISREALIASETWFLKNGAWVLFASRFLPGTRVPVFLAAGILKAPSWLVALVLMGAALIWVPVLVLISSWIGEHLLGLYEHFDLWAGWLLLATMFLLVVLLHRCIPLLTYRGRRLAYSRWMRLIRWEFWPAKILYLPIFVYIIGLSIRYRSYTLPSLANPMIPCGGWVDESKLSILGQLQEAGAPVAPFAEIDAGLGLESATQTVLQTMDARGWQFPIVVKPDRGERGKGVVIVRSEAMLKQLLANRDGTLIAQQYIPGMEFGVLYRRYPGETSGKICSLTRKHYTAVRGDGHATLEQLILRDSRAVMSAKIFLEAHSHALSQVPAKGETIPLVEIGTHARGALFLDASELITDALLESLDRISHAVDGFYLGRFDLKVLNEQALIDGGPLHILELNLLTSEPTHMYDPKYSVWQAWRLLMDHWRSAFEIGDRIRASGRKPMGGVAFFRLLRQHYLP